MIPQPWLSWYLSLHVLALMTGVAVSRMDRTLMSLTQARAVADPMPPHIVQPKGGNTQLATVHGCQGHSSCLPPLQLVCTHTGVLHRRSTCFQHLATNESQQSDAASHCHKTTTGAEHRCRSSQAAGLTSMLCWCTASFQLQTTLCTYCIKRLAIAQHLLHQASVSWLPSGRLCGTTWPCPLA